MRARALHVSYITSILNQASTPVPELGIASILVEYNVSRGDRLTKPSASEIPVRAFQVWIARAGNVGLSSCLNGMVDRYW
jgi:hypothetical protein